MTAKNFEQLFILF